MEKKFSAKYIDADMLKHPFGKRSARSKGVGFQPANLEVPGKRDGRPGEIKGKILLIRHDLYDMGIEPISHLHDPSHESGHLEGIINDERPDRFINDVSFDERFVSLNIDDDF